MYTAIYQYILAQPRIAELTVEDPAEAFEDLRDRNDLRMLLSHEQFIPEALGGGKEGGLVKGKAKLGPPVQKGWAEKWRQDLKIAGVCTTVTSPYDQLANHSFELEIYSDNSIVSLRCSSLNTSISPTLEPYGLTDFKLKSACSNSTTYVKDFFWSFFALAF